MDETIIPVDCTDASGMITDDVRTRRPTNTEVLILTILVTIGTARHSRQAAPEGVSLDSDLRLLSLRDSARPPLYLRPRWSG